MQAANEPITHTDLNSDCTNCGAIMRPFFELLGVPTNSCLLVDSKAEALGFPRGDIVLGFCDGCGFVRNLAYQAVLTEYSGRYEETQSFSPTFRAFHTDLAQDMVSRLQLRGKHIVEIGCGKGEFLALLCQLGTNTGVGFDPSFDDTRNVLPGELDVRVRKELFDANTPAQNADLVCCKMTLEHIRESGRFVAELSTALRPGTDSTLFVQVPESSRIFQDCAFEDIYYEHCNYFTTGSLARLARRSGLHIDRLGCVYGSQYLTLEAHLVPHQADGAAQPVLPQEDSVAQTQEHIATFQQRYDASVAKWRQLVADARAKGGVVLWGSGSKAVSFLHALNMPGVIDQVVDVNPHRHGHYMLGTGEAIIGPEQLQASKPHTVIVMNRVYRAEIERNLSELGLAPAVVAL